MKTTLELPDELYREVKVQAALRGKTITSLVTEALGQALREKSKPLDTKKSSKNPASLKAWIKKEELFLSKMRGPVHGRNAVKELIEGRR